MNSKASPEQMARARRLLAHEGAVGGADACVAAGRVFDKLRAQLAPLVGSAGVHALLVRSVKLTCGEFSFLDVAVVDDATKLRACLQTQEPAIAAASAALLFGTFFTLITTFIGERLTTQVLRRSWPTIEETTPRESKP